LKLLSAGEAPMLPVFPYFEAHKEGRVAMKA
jgi:hypothetical protein